MSEDKKLAGRDRRGLACVLGCGYGRRDGLVPLEPQRPQPLDAVGGAARKPDGTP
jgi:hypothetical protein